MNRLSVRRFRPQDLPLVLRLEQLAFPREAYSAELFRGLAQKCGPAFLVAWLGRQALGYAVSCRFRHGAELVSIAVRPDVQGRGVGSRLLLATERAWQRQGVPKLFLAVRVSNERAQAFYRRHGFSRRARTPGYYEDGEDGFRMHKDLLPLS